MKKEDEVNLKEIADLIADFREGEIAKPSPEHVEKWVTQFDSDEQSAVLSGTRRLLEKTYMTRADIKKWLGFLFTTPLLSGADPAAWLKKANFIRGGSSDGNSQDDLLEIVDAVIRRKTDFALEDCGEPDGVYVYVDDCIFTGQTVINDLKLWLENYDGPKCLLHVFTAGTYSSGEHWAKKVLKPLATPKGVTLHFWHAFAMSNFKDDHGADAHLLRPAVLPSDPAVNAYFNSLRKEGQWLRAPGKVYKDDSLFASEGERQVLEGAFLKAGVKIRNAASNPKVSVRPMGFQRLDSLGFGATFFTFRNAANNLPLALWWGDQKKYPKSHPLGMWYPLVPRRPKDG